MLSRVTTYKKKSAVKKIMILCGALILSVSIGSGVKTTFADADANTLLINWFKNKESESVKEIDRAITDEKKVLLAQLKEELKIEMASAEKELTAYTEKEKSERIASLRQYAKGLVENLNTDTSEQKEKFSSQIDSIVEEAIKKMEAVSVVIPENTPVSEDSSSKPEEKELGALIVPAQNSTATEPVSEPASITVPVDKPESDSSSVEESNNE